MTDIKIFNGKYKVHSFYYHMDPEGEWISCPFCGLRPRVWVFDNGRKTACGCWNDRYQGFSISAESVMSVYRRTGCTQEYDVDALRTNWNHWCSTGEILFDRRTKQKDCW